MDGIEAAIYQFVQSSFTKAARCHADIRNLEKRGGERDLRLGCNLSRSADRKESVTTVVREVSF